MTGLSDNKGNQFGIVDLLSRALPTRHKKKVEGRAFRKRDVRIYRESLGAYDRLGRLRDDQASLGPLNMLSPHGEHLPGAGEIKFFNPGKYQNTKIHTELAVARGLPLLPARTTSSIPRIQRK